MAKNSDEVNGSRDSAESVFMQQTELDRYFLIPVRHASFPAEVKIKRRSKRGQRKRRWTS